MHFDLAHAVVAAVLIFIVLWILEKTGIARNREKGKNKWDWRMFSIVFVVLLILNLVWPYQ